MPSGPVRQWWRALSAHLSPPQKIHPSSQDPLLLVYNSMWDQSIDHEIAALCPGYRITTDQHQLRDATAVVFHIPSLRDLPRRKSRGQVWVAWSMESDVNYPRLRDPGFMKQFDLTMSYRLDADVVATYTTYKGSVAEFAKILRTPPQPKSSDKLAALFISSHINRSGRIEYARELLRYLQIDSYGKMLQNRVLPEPDRGQQTKLAILAQYKFNLALENSCSEDYVTEKFFDPLIAGTVPVYLGAPNVDRFAPGDHCFINTSDFQNPKALADYLLYLDRDESAYVAYLAWKEQPFRSSFQALLDGQETPPFARLCRGISARRSSL